MPATPTTTIASWYSLTVLVLVTLFGFVDRQVFVLLAEPIRLDLGLSDLHLGMLQGLGVALFAAVAGYPIAWLADATDRRLVLTLCVVIWSLAVAACGLADSFVSLFLASAIVGVGEAGLVPIVYALIPQAFAENQRALANSIYAISTRLGIGLAIWFCSIVIVGVDAARDLLPEPLQGMETWRLSFLAAALPALVIIPLMFTLKATPAPKRKEAAPTGSARVEPKVLQHLLAHPRTLFGFFIAMGFAAFGFASIISWVPVIVGRMYGVEPAAAGAATGAATLIATVVGFLVSVGCQRLFAKRLGARLPIVFLSVASFLGAVTSFALVAARSPLDIYVLQGVQMAAAIVALMIVPTALQDISPPALRSRIIAINGVAMIVFGACSPVIVGALSDALGERPDALLLAALSAATIGLLLAAVVFWWSGKTYAATVEASR